MSEVGEHQLAGEVQVVVAVVVPHRAAGPPASGIACGPRCADQEWKTLSASRPATSALEGAAGPGGPTRYGSLEGWSVVWSRVIGSVSRLCVVLRPILAAPGCVTRTRRPSARSCAATALAGGSSPVGWPQLQVGLAEASRAAERATPDRDFVQFEELAAEGMLGILEGGWRSGCGKTHPDAAGLAAGRRARAADQRGHRLVEPQRRLGSSRAGARRTSAHPPTPGLRRREARGSRPQPVRRPGRAVGRTAACGCARKSVEGPASSGWMARQADEESLGAGAERPPATAASRVGKGVGRERSDLRPLRRAG